MALRNRAELLLIVVALLIGGAFAGTPSSKHIVLVVEENHGYDETFAGMPRLKTVAEDYAIATNYYADCHPSIGNYFIMTTGQKITTNDFTRRTVLEENIVSQIEAAKKTWKVYADGLPATGYIGGNDGQTGYVKRHVPMAYFDTVRSDDTKRANLVPFDQFKKDLQASGLPNFSMVIPNIIHDAHSASLEIADRWLEDNVVVPLLADKDFQNDGVLIITFDEARNSDKEYGGGHVATVLVGRKVKRKYKDDKFTGNFYQHESLFVTLESLLGLKRLAIVENVKDLGDLFQ